MRRVKSPSLEVPGTAAAELSRNLDAQVPGIADYVVDERGCLRLHVNLFVDQDVVVDKDTLSDRVPADGTLHIFKALSGG